MSYSYVKIEFTGIPNLDDIFGIREDKLSINLIERFKTQRLGFQETRLPVYIPPTGTSVGRWDSYVHNNYKNAINLDFNASNLFTITTEDGPAGSALGSITITANYPGAIFRDTYLKIPSTIITIENSPGIPEIEIQSVTFSEASNDKCNIVKVSCQTNVLATKILSPIQNYSNTDNPFYFDWIRGTRMEMDVSDDTGRVYRGVYYTPSILSASNFLINVNNSPNGATVLIENSNTSGLELQYSLDNVNWQSSNTFSGLEVGQFNLYVKDQLGCSFNKTFSVDEFGIQAPYFYISKSNSIRYAQRVDFANVENYKTDENTLSCEVDVDEPYKEVQQFQSNYIAPTQFRSNFKNNIAKVIKYDLTEIIIPVEKKSNNIGIKDKRDARKYNLGNGRTGIYFLAGNVYDYDTNEKKEEYSLNGNLPEWAIVGNYIIISNAWFLIEDIIFDESKNADIIIFSQNYAGSDVSVVVGSIFNRFNYEVYEFYIDMSNYIDERFRVSFVNSDPNFSTITHLSEEIWCKVKHEDVLEIMYRNNTNTDIFYATGITYKLWIPLTIQKGIPEEESEIHKTDTSATLLNADLYEGDQFIFEPVTKEIWRKIMIALSHEKVWLNGVEYVKNGSFSTEGPLEKSNLYVLTANMLKTGNVYNSPGDGYIGIDGTEVDVPRLISTEAGFVSY